MKYIIITGILFSILMAGAGCDKSSKGKLLAADKMQTVTWDILQADAYAELYIKTDSLKNFTTEKAALQQKVFDIHKIGKEDFYYSYDYYNARPDVMRVILDSVSAKAERNRNTIVQKKYSKYAK